MDSTYFSICTFNILLCLFNWEKKSRKQFLPLFLDSVKQILILYQINP